MKTITVRNDSANLDLTLDELIIIRNSLKEVLSENSIGELSTITGYYPQEIEIILNSVEQIIKEFD